MGGGDSRLSAVNNSGLSLRLYHKRKRNTSAQQGGGGINARRKRKMANDGECGDHQCHHHHHHQDRTRRQHKENDCDKDKETNYAKKGEAKESGAGQEKADDERLRHPTRLTHSTWLRQYSWLHSGGGEADCGNVSASPEHGPSVTTTTAAPNKRPRLFARLTNKMRSQFGGSTGKIIISGEEREEKKEGKIASSSSAALGGPEMMTIGPNQQPRKKARITVCSEPAGCDGAGTGVGIGEEEKKADDRNETACQTPGKRARKYPPLGQLCGLATCQSSSHDTNSETATQKCWCTSSSSSAKDDNNDNNNKPQRVESAAGKQRNLTPISDFRGLLRSVSSSTSALLGAGGGAAAARKPPATDSGPGLLASLFVSPRFRRHKRTLVLGDEPRAQAKELRQEIKAAAGESQTKEKEETGAGPSDCAKAVLTSGISKSHQQKLLLLSSPGKSSLGPAASEPETSSAFKSLEGNAKMRQDYANERQPAARPRSVTMKLSPAEEGEKEKESESGRHQKQAKAESELELTSASEEEEEEDEDDDQDERQCGRKQNYLPLIQPLASSPSSMASSANSFCYPELPTPFLACGGGGGASSSSHSPRQLGRQHSGQTDKLDSSNGLNDDDGDGDGDGDATSRHQFRPVSQPNQSSASNLEGHASNKESSATNSGLNENNNNNLRSHFKKLVKRQQSVDSYRMARELKNKQKRQQEVRERKHQSNEAIKSTQSNGGDSTAAARTDRGDPSTRNTENASSAASTRASERKFSMRLFDSNERSIRFRRDINDLHKQESKREATKEPVICVDPYARPGSFTLPGEKGPNEESSSPSSPPSSPPAREKPKPVPPNTLCLLPSAQLGQSVGSMLGSGAAFGGCITPTYPTHHLPSPKYVSPATLMAMQAKKYSNASTISSSLGAGESSLNLTPNPAMNSNNNGNQLLAAGSPASQLRSGSTPSTNGRSQRGETDLYGIGKNTNINNNNNNNSHSHSDTDGSLTGAASPNVHLPLRSQVGVSVASGQPAELDAQMAAKLAEKEAQRRANLAEHIYDNKCGLGEDMKFLASLPELCDITFLVGETREPVCAVKSVLAARSRVFHKILFGNQVRAMQQQQQQQQILLLQQQQQQQLQRQPLDESTPPKATSDDGESGGQSRMTATRGARRGSSPRPASKTLASKNSQPNSRSSSPNQQTQPQQQQQQQQQQWSVKTDASGYNAAAPLQPVPSAEPMIGGPRSGRMSAISTSTMSALGGSGRESISLMSAGSQQPLIIGPGQTATPAPPSKQRPAASSKQRHHHPATGRHKLGERQESSTSSGSGPASRLSRMFMNKRASDPSIKQQQQQQHHHHQHQTTENGHQDQATEAASSSSASAAAAAAAAAMAASTLAANQNYLDKMSSSQMSTTMIIEEFEPDVFRQLIEYIHTGCVLLQARTLLGLLNAADYYGLEQLRKACLRFVSCCITVDTVCSLLSTAERYIQYKCTKSIVQKVLEFVDNHADEIFKLNAFGLLPEHVVRLILARDGLQADELVKYNGVYTWCEHYCRSYELTNISDVMRNFLDLIQFHKIPMNILLSEIYPTHLVPDEIFLSALAYQADPEIFEPPADTRPRRMTLPNPVTASQRDYVMAHLAGQAASPSGAKGELPRPASSNSPRNVHHPNHHHQLQHNNTNQTTNNYNNRRESTTTTGSGSQQRLWPLITARKSTGGTQCCVQQTPSPPPPAAAPVQKSKAGRKGSIAQASISGVMRLSHKLSIRSRRSPVTAGRRGSGGQALKKKDSRDHQHQIMSRSPVSGGTASSCGARDPMAVGQQILDAYLEAQRQRELEEELKQRKEGERDLAEDGEHCRASSAGGGGGGATEQKIDSREPGSTTAPDYKQQQPQSASGGQQQVGKRQSATRKSFRDFKHISRRLFMRRSSSKVLQTATSDASAKSSHSLATTGKTHSIAVISGSANLGSSSATSARRNLLKIKRSETVFETTACDAGQTQHKSQLASVTAKLTHQLSSGLIK